MRKIVLILSCFLLLNCNKKQDAKPVEKQFEMYQATEMAALMEQMYVENDQLKKRILDNESVGKFPTYFEKIHTAKMTDESENDDFFKENAKLFIDAQKLIYTDSLNAKKHFNSMVNACITCHEVKCGGPIAKIKKLRITN